MLDIFYKGVPATIIHLNLIFNYCRVLEKHSYVSQKEKVPKIPEDKDSRIKFTSLILDKSKSKIRKATMRRKPQKQSSVYPFAVGKHDRKSWSIQMWRQKKWPLLKE